MHPSWLSSNRHLWDLITALIGTQLMCNKVDTTRPNISQTACYKLKKTIVNLLDFNVVRSLTTRVEVATVSNKSPAASWCLVFSIMSVFLCFRCKAKCFITPLLYLDLTSINIPLLRSTSISWARGAEVICQPLSSDLCRPRDQPSVGRRWPGTLAWIYSEKQTQMKCVICLCTGLH